MCNVKYELGQEVNLKFKLVGILLADNGDYLYKLHNPDIYTLLNGNLVQGTSDVYLVSHSEEEKDI